MQGLQNFFLFCSGVNPLVLKRAPADVGKYANIGATVFFTGVFAFMAASYACFTVFKSYPMSILFGLIWGLMIFNLDRYLVSSMKRKANLLADSMMALPRLVLAILIALVISKPIELKIFDTEIKSELISMEQERFKEQEQILKSRYEDDINTLNVEILALESSFAERQKNTDILLNESIKEADGTGGSQQKNLGPIYKTKRAAYEKSQAELQKLSEEISPLVHSKRNQIDAYRQEIDEEIASLKRVPLDGFAARVEALSRLGSKSSVILLASIFITLLFIAIECAPILAKLMSSRSPYDFVLDEHEEKYKMAHFKRTNLLRNLTTSKVRMDTEIKKAKTLRMIEMEKQLANDMVKEEYDKLKSSLSWKDVFRRKNVLGFED